MAAVEPKVFKTDRKQRHGKGFSREEIRKADSSPAEALRFGVRVDFKRKTAHEENVEALKAYLKAKIAAKPKVVAKPKAATKPGRKTKS
jgi:large subunit ribosomal protein L13e